MSKCIVTEPFSFEEAVEDPAWVDAMVEDMIRLSETVHGRLSQGRREISGRFEMDLQSEASC